MKSRTVLVTLIGLALLWGLIATLWLARSRPGEEAAEGVMRDPSPEPVPLEGELMDLPPARDSEEDASASEARTLVVDEQPQIPLPAGEAELEVTVLSAQGGSPVSGVVAFLSPDPPESGWSSSITKESVGTHDQGLSSDEAGLALDPRGDGLDHFFRSGDSHGLGQLLQTGCDVDVFAKEVAGPFPHRSFVDAHADFNRFDFGELSRAVALAVAGRNLGQGVKPTANRGVSLVENHHVRIAELLDHPAAVSLDHRIHDVVVLAEHFEGGGLVLRHHAAVALDVGEHHGQMRMFNFSHL